MHNRRLRHGGTRSALFNFSIVQISATRSGVVVPRPLWWVLGHWEHSQAVRQCVPELDPVAGQPCRLLHLYWNKVLKAEEAKAFYLAAQREAEPIESEEGDIELSTGYTHAEHFSDKEESLHDGSDSDYQVYYEGNCAWQGGCIVGYSSDCDFS